MSCLAVELGNSAKDAVLNGDPYRAAQIRHEDDAMDELHRHLFTVLMDHEWKHGHGCTTGLLVAFQPVIAAKARGPDSIGCIRSLSPFQARRCAALPLRGLCKDFRP